LNHLMDRDRVLLVGVLKQIIHDMK